MVGTGWLVVMHFFAASGALVLFFLANSTRRRYLREADDALREDEGELLTTYALSGAAFALVIAIGAVTADTWRWWPLLIVEGALIVSVWAMWALAFRGNAYSEIETSTEGSER